MTNTLDATMRTIVETTQFSHADVTAAIETLRAYPDNEAPVHTPWTDEQLADRLPTLAAMAAQSGRSLPSVAQGVRTAVGVVWDGPADQPESEVFG